MKRCVELAKNGLGRTYPNPLVGCVIVWKDTIIGEGWHQKPGEAHAEVNALKSVKEQSKLSAATLYVNLEPCSHQGRTPPCSDLIIKKGIKNVVIGMIDPNPKVAGQGVAKLKQSGIKVVVGCLAEEVKILNKRFLCAQLYQRPYVILKWAQTEDGFIAPKKQKMGHPTWITHISSKQLVHKWRSQEQGILVGKNTALKDNPQLNTRLWAGKNPVRLLIDPTLKSFSSSDKLHLYDRQIKTIVLCKHPDNNQNNLIFEAVNFQKEPIAQILNILFKHHLQSVIVEGGQKTLDSFLRENLWDEARVFTGKTRFHSGIKAPLLKKEPQQVCVLKKDQLKIYRND